MLKAFRVVATCFAIHVFAFQADGLAQTSTKHDPLDCGEVGNALSLNLRQLEQVERNCTRDLQEMKAAGHPGSPIYQVQRGRIRAVIAIQMGSRALVLKALEDFDESERRLSPDPGCHAWMLALRSLTYIWMKEAQKARDDLLLAERMFKSSTDSTCVVMREDTPKAIARAKEGLRSLDAAENVRQPSGPSQAGPRSSAPNQGSTANNNSLSPSQVERLLIGCKNIPRGPITRQLEIQLRPDEQALCKGFLETMRVCQFTVRNPDVYGKCLRENYAGR